jgi:hypothetical protein
MVDLPQAPTAQFHLNQPRLYVVLSNQSLHLSSVSIVIDKRVREIVELDFRAYFCWSHGHVIFALVLL